MTVAPSYQTRDVFLLFAGTSDSQCMRKNLIDRMTETSVPLPKEYRELEKKLICVAPGDSEGAPSSSITVHFLNMPDLDENGSLDKNGLTSTARFFRNRIKPIWNPATDTMGLIYFHDIRKPRLRASCEVVIKALCEGLALGMFHAVSIVVTHEQKFTPQDKKKMKKHCGNPKLDESILKSAYLWEIYKSPESYQEMWEILDLHLIFRSTEQRNWEETNRKVSDLKRQCKRSRVWKWIFITAEIGAQLCIAAGALTATALTAGLASPTLIGAAFVGAFLEHVCAKERERHAKKKNQLREAEVLRRDVERRLPAAPIIKVGHPIGISATGSSRPYILSLDKLGELGLGMPAAGVQPRAHCHPTQLQRQPPAQHHRESASAPLAPPPPPPAPPYRGPLQKKPPAQHHRESASAPLAPPPPPPAPPYRGPLQKKPPAQYHRESASASPAPPPPPPAPPYRGPLQKESLAQYHRESASASLAPPPPPPAPPYRGPLQRQPPFPLASTVVDIKKATMVQLDTI